MFDAHQVFKKLGDAGLLGITRDPEYGGLGLDYSYSVAFFEELAKINCGGIPGAIITQTDNAIPPLSKFGSDDLKKEFLIPTISGDYVACVGVSEPNSSTSDLSALKTYAKHDGEDLIINGSKTWVTNGLQADWMCMLVNTVPDAPSYKNKSLVCVPLNEPGVIKGRKINTMGTRSSDTAELFFENVRVPKKNIIGEQEGQALKQMSQFQDERLCISILAVESMNRIIQECIDYCRQRFTFDLPLIDNQYIHFKLAELQAEVELLKCLNYQAVDMLIADENITFVVSIAKLKAGRLIRVVCDTCLQFYGGMGFTEDLLIARAYRDNRLLSIAGGSDEIMLSIICQIMGIKPKRHNKEET